MSSFDLEFSKVRARERLDQVHRDRQRSLRVIVSVICFGAGVLFAVLWWGLRNVG